MQSTAPATMRAWQFSATTGGIEKNLKLNTVPTPKPKPDQHLVRVIATALNPVDYKIAEAPIIGSLATSKPATPGLDIAGEIVVPATGSPFQPGQLVYGLTGGALSAGGGLAEYVAVPKSSVVAVPNGVSAVDAASLPVTGVTAYQSIALNAKAGDRVLINGGSGSVGLFAIQIAKNVGAHVTVTTSTRNAELCKSLGADEVVDYTKGDVISMLKALPYKFDLILDGVGKNHALYWQSDEYTNEGAKFVSIAFQPPKDIPFLILSQILPRFLGGSSRKIVHLFSESTQEYMTVVMNLLQQGKLKTVIDTVYPLEEVPEAIIKLKSSRARGKLVVEIAAQ